MQKISERLMLFPRVNVSITSLKNSFFLFHNLLLKMWMSHPEAICMARKQKIISIRFMKYSKKNLMLSSNPYKDQYSKMLKKDDKDNN